MPEELAVEADVICGATAARCICGEPPGHPPPHECHDKEWCNGAWSEDECGFVVLRLPGLSADRPELNSFLSELLNGT
jgi:hypothetical protein